MDHGKLEKVHTLTFNKEDEDQSRSHNNFSQMAQDGYMELLQFLTEKIFSSIEYNNDVEDSAVVSSVCSKEPCINNLAKYEVIHFKNPFETA